MEKAVRLEFPTSNNEAKYKETILVVRLAFKMGARKVKLFIDSILVTNKFRGSFETKNERMVACQDNGVLS